MIPGQTVHRRLVILFMAAVACVLLLALLAHLVQYSRLRGELEQRALQTAERLAVTMSRPMWNVDKVYLNELISLELKNPELVLIQLKSVDGKQYAGRQKDAASLPRFSVQQVMIEKRIFYEEMDIGTIKIALNDSQILKQTGEKLLNTLIELVLVLVVASLITYRGLDRLLLLPLQHLHQVAQAFGEGNFDARTNLKTSDEIGALGTTLNQMADRLETTLAATRQSAEDLLRQKNLITTIIESTSEAIFAKDTTGKYIFINEAGARMLGYRVADILDRTDMELLQPEMADELRKTDEQIMSSGQVFKREETSVIDGKACALLIHKAPWLDYSGKIIGVIGVLSDITERKLAQQKLERYSNHLEVMIEERTSELLLARDAAEAANRAKSMFLANMSHEIRTPMNAVLGFAQLLQHDSSLSPAALNKVATIIKSGDHLLAIINDILEMSRIEAGRVELRTQSVDLCGLLDDLSVMFRMRCEGKGLSFTLESAPDLPRYIVADLGKLRQIMVNLLGNAVKFTQTGSITLRAAFVDSTRLAIEVQDSGIGISFEEQTKLFHPFERTKSGEQAAGGTGLGLSISREYAQLMGGNITVTSKPGEGSCFCFAFPVQATSDAPAASDRPRRITGLIPGQGEIRVLVVDDLKENRELLRGMLEPLGFIIDEATDGQEAIDKVNTRKPQMILMDQVMPGMNGSEATSILRVTHSKESLPIIGITASTFEDEKQQFRKAGLNAYIAKPFREQELYDVLSRYAGVLFETEEDAASPDMQQDTELPTLEKMSSEWCEAFHEALTRKNITRIRILGEEAKATDPVLSEWLLERAGRYDLDGLKKLGT